MLPLYLAGVALAIALIAYLLLSEADEKAIVRESLRQLDDYEVDNVRDQELLDSFGQRTLVPVLQRFTKLGRRLTPVGYIENTRHKFAALGRSGSDDLDRFLAVRVLTVAAVPFAILLVTVATPLSGMLRLATIVCLCVGLLLGPTAVVNRKVEERKLIIRKQLPDILDLLVISVEAGLGFEQALDRTIASVPGPLSDEFARMLGEVRAGSSRGDGMRALERRLDIPEVRSFVLAILQADTFGVSIGRVLRAQAEEMRIKRRQLAQEQAMKAPVKMLIPMVFCIFPALFVITLGPAALSITKSL